MREQLTSRCSRPPTYRKSRQRDAGCQWHEQLPQIWMTTNNIPPEKPEEWPPCIAPMPLHSNSQRLVDSALTFKITSVIWFISWQLSYNLQRVTFKISNWCDLIHLMAAVIIPCKFQNKQLVGFGSFDGSCHLSALMTNDANYIHLNAGIRPQPLWKKSTSQHSTRLSDQTHVGLLCSLWKVGPRFW